MDYGLGVFSTRTSFRTADTKTITSSLYCLLSLFLISSVDAAPNSKLCRVFCYLFRSKRAINRIMRLLRKLLAIDPPGLYGHSQVHRRRCCLVSSRPCYLSSRLEQIPDAFRIIGTLVINGATQNALLKRLANPRHPARPFSKCVLGFDQEPNENGQIDRS